MKTLLTKEKDILFRINLLNMLVTYIMSIPYAIFRSKGNFDLALIVIIGVSTAINLQASLNAEIISNTDMLFVSMPMDRDLIVKSKYVSALLMMINSLVIFIVAILLSMSTFYYGSSFFEIINLGNITITISIIILFLSFYLQTYYFSTKGANNRTLLDKIFFISPYILILLFMLMNRDITYLKNTVLKFDNPIFVVFVFAISLLLYYISYLISANIYRNAEF